MIDRDMVGARIATARHNLHLTQHALARRANVSYSLLTKVESGARPASDAMIAACARALGLTPQALSGASSSADVTSQELRDMLVPIRYSLDLFDLDPEEGVTPRSVPELRRAVAEVNTLAQAARYRPMAALLPGLLSELHALAHLSRGSESIAAWGLLAEAYRCGHSFAIAMGEPDISTTALSRMDWAARGAGDRAPALRAIRDYLRVTAYLREGAYDACRRLHRSAATHLAGADAATPNALVATGQVHLGAAMIAARTGDRDGSTAHLEAAERIAHRTGEQVQALWVAFGPTNVLAHRVTTELILGRPQDAVVHAASLRPPAGWLPTRIGSHHIDLANARLMLGQPDEAVAELQRARAEAPLQVRRHPRVRRAVDDLRRAQRRSSAALTSFVTWLDTA